MTAKGEAAEKAAEPRPRPKRKRRPEAPAPPATMRSDHGGRSGQAPPGSAGSTAYVQRALESLAAAARERLARHPEGHRVASSKTRLDLRLTIPLGPLTVEVLEQAQGALEAELNTLLDHHQAFLPGRVFCLRCGEATCGHSRSEDSRQVFAGYGASGMPRFEDFGQWLLERRSEHLDLLYQKPPRLATEITLEGDLHGQLLPAWRDRKTDYCIHGQVTAGWFQVPRLDGLVGMLALTFQVLSSAGHRRGRRLLGLNVLGCGPQGEPLGSLYDRLDSLPWKPALLWGQEALESLERAQGRGMTREVLAQRIEGILGGISRRLQQGRRARDRRTEHAEKRHTSGERPTHMALVDFSRARDESVLFDQRKETLVVLGARGRAHVWNAEGKLVTSIRYTTDSIERKKKQDIWRQARKDEILALRKKLGTQLGAVASDPLGEASD